MIGYIVPSYKRKCIGLCLETSFSIVLDLGKNACHRFLRKRHAYIRDFYKGHSDSKYSLTKDTGTMCCGQQKEEVKL